jgi:hypothetical protein
MIGKLIIAIGIILAIAVIVGAISFPEAVGLFIAGVIGIFAVVAGIVGLIIFGILALLGIG